MTNYSRMNDAETDVLPVIKGNGNNFQLNPKQYLIDQNQEYMKYMTGNSYVSNNGRNELKEGQTFNFIRVVDIKTCKSDPPLYDAVYNEILGIEEYIDAHEGNTMNGLLGTGQWASFDPLALNPLDLKKALKRTFNITLSPKELAAVIKLFEYKGTKIE